MNRNKPAEPEDNPAGEGTRAAADSSVEEVGSSAAAWEGESTREGA